MLDGAGREAPGREVCLELREGDEAVAVLVGRVEPRVGRRRHARLRGGERLRVVGLAVEAFRIGRLRSVAEEELAAPA